MKRVNIGLANIPSFAKDEYDPDQVKFYAKMTELIHGALSLNSIQNFINELHVRLNIKEDIEIRIMRLPFHKTRIIYV